LVARLSLFLSLSPPPSPALSVVLPLGTGWMQKVMAFPQELARRYVGSSTPSSSEPWHHHPTRWLTTWTHHSGGHKRKGWEMKAIDELPDAEEEEEEEEEPRYEAMERMRATKRQKSRISASVECSEALPGQGRPLFLPTEIATRPPLPPAAAAGKEGRLASSDEGEQVNERYVDTNRLLYRLHQERELRRRNNQLHGW